MGAFYMGLAAYTDKRYAGAQEWWHILVQEEKPAMYYGDLYLPVLFGGYADICLRAGITPAAVKALQKQMKYLKEQGPVWYRAQGLIYLLSGDERGALTSLEKALKGMDPADPQLKKLTETLRKRVKP